MKKTAITIEFEDLGQDFQKWDLADDGEILASYPFGETNKGNHVRLDTIKVGERPVIHLSYGAYRSPFPIINITNHLQ